MAPKSLSEAVDRLGRNVPAASSAESPAYVHEAFVMGIRVDVANVGEVLAMLDELE